MLIKLSLRNARRQLKEYCIYFATITISIAMLYSFNSFIFSNAFQHLVRIFSDSGDNGTTYVVIFYSCIIVVVVGWLISYMLNFMLRKRSSEFATYMLLGIEKKEICRLYIRENIIVGIIALIVGLFTGYILSKFINFIINFFLDYNLYSQLFISWKAIIITVMYFCLIYIILLIFSKNRFKKLNLLNLLNYDQYNEIPSFKKPGLGILVFVISILCGIGSIILFFYEPLSGNYSNIATGFLLIILCQFGIYIGICPVFLHIYFKKQTWKKSSTNTFIFRLLTAKINKLTTLYGLVASLLTIALLFISTGIGYGYSVNKLLDLNSFDISILHIGNKEGLNRYEKYLNQNYNMTDGYAYNLYTDETTTFTDIRNTVLSKYFKQRHLNFEPKEYLYDLNKYDMYISYTDYNMLRKILGYRPIEMDDKHFLIHCMPYLQKGFQDESSNISLSLSGESLSLAEIVTENFSLYDGYGNGQEFIVVVPDKFARNLKVAYSLYSTQVVDAEDMSFINALSANFSSLKLMDLNFTQGVSGSDTYMTKLSFGDSKDYLCGKYIILSTKAEITLIISLIFLGVLLSIACTVILAVQLLSDNTINSQRYYILHLLGMDKPKISNILKKQISIYFLLPAIPTALLSIGLINIVIQMVINEYFLVPVFNNSSLIVTYVFFITIASFTLIYMLYAMITYFVAKKDILNGIYNNKS